MATKKVNPIRSAIEKAVKNYVNGAAGLVRVYETVIDRYWNEDSRSTDNLVYFVNLLNDHPRVQQALVRIMSKHGKFQIKSEGKPVDKNYKITELKNVKVTPEQRDDYLAAIRVFKAAQLTSFLNEEGEINRDFNADKAKEGLKKKALSFVAELMIKHETDQELARLALDNPEDFEGVPFNLESAFNILSEIMDDVRGSSSELSSIKEDILERNKAIAEAKAEKAEKLKAARLDIIAEAQATAETTETATAE